MSTILNPITLPASKMLETMTTLIGDVRFEDNLGVSDIVNEMVDSARIGQVDYGKGIINTFKLAPLERKTLTETSSAFTINKPNIAQETILIDNYYFYEISMSEILSRDALLSGDAVSTFMAYCMERISNVAGYFKRPSTSFNNGSIVTWSRKVNLALLNDFVNANTFRNLANTFNEQLLTLPKYDRVTAWQGVKDSSGTFSFEQLSKVVATDPDNKLGFKASEVENVYTVNNVIGLLYDDKALGITVHNQKTTSSYTAATDHTNTFDHIRANWLIDTDYNIVAFVLD